MNVNGTPPFEAKKEGAFTVGIKMNRDVALSFYGEDGDGLLCLTNKDHDPIVDFEMCFGKDYLNEPCLYIGGDIDTVTNVLTAQILPRLKQIQNLVEKNQKNEEQLSRLSLQLKEMEEMHVDSLENRDLHDAIQNEKADQDPNHVRIPYRSESISSESESESLASRSSSSHRSVFTRSYSKKFKNRLRKSSQCQIRQGPMAKYLGQFLGTLKKVRLPSQGIEFGIFELALLHFIQLTNRNFHNLTITQGFTDRLMHMLLHDHSHHIAQIPNDQMKVLVSLDRR